MSGLDTLDDIIARSDAKAAKKAEVKPKRNVGGGKRSYNMTSLSDPSVKSLLAAIADLKVDVTVDSLAKVLACLMEADLRNKVPQDVVDRNMQMTKLMFEMFDEVIIQAKIVEITNGIRGIDTKPFTLLNPSEESNEQPKTG